jgi:hypothetical protein
MAEDGAGGGNLRRARLAAGRSYGAPLDVTVTGRRQPVEIYELMSLMEA